MRGIIVVPYRDRAGHLARFRDAIKPYGLPLVVVEQADNLPFNRAKLFNVFAKRLGGFYDYYVFHDVDMIPVNPDYSYPEVPTHIATMCSQFHYMMPYAEYFGGVTLFNKADFKAIDGYSNDFWGWGGEDDEMYRNVLRNGLEVNRRWCRFESLPHNRDIDNGLHQKNINRLAMGRKSGLKDCKFKLIEDELDYIKVSFA